jgi:hypothetical protein
MADSDFHGGNTGSNPVRDAIHSIEHTAGVLAFFVQFGGLMFALPGTSYLEAQTYFVTTTAISNLAGRPE